MLDTFILITALIRCVTLFCVTNVIVTLRNPWLVALYLLVPLMSSFKDPFVTDEKEIQEDGKE